MDNKPKEKKTIEHQKQRDRARGRICKNALKVKEKFSFHVEKKV